MTLALDKKALLDSAVAAFHLQTGLGLTQCLEHESRRIDACLQLRPHGTRYSAELKRWAQHVGTGSVVAELRRLPAPALLVADYINPNMADRLRKAGVRFIDTAGNVYLNDDGLYIFIKGNRPVAEPAAPRKTTRAFNASGLKVIFNLLLNPGIVNETYRTIAKIAGVSLGTIGWVLNDLKEGGYLQEQGRKRARKLVRPLELLDRWVEAYPEKLLPGLELGAFQTPFPTPWNEIVPSKHGGFWSGEVAASMVDDYLSPAQGLVYLPRARLKDFVIENRLRKSRDSTSHGSETIRIRETFWQWLPDRPDGPLETVAPDILVYADLLISEDPRNHEAAQGLYDRIEARFQID